LRVKNFAIALVVGAASLAYRLHLFFGQYHGERGIKHIGGGDFTIIYVVNLLLFAAAAFASRILWYHSPRWTIASVTVAVANGVGWITLFAMHRTGILVEYGEFLRHWRGAV